MAQNDFGTIDPNTKSGTALASDLNDFRDAVNSNHSGTSQPSYQVAGMIWVDNTSSDLLAKIVDEAGDDVEIFEVDASTNKINLNNVQDLTVSGSVSLGIGSLGGFRNRLINADFPISQQGTSFTGGTDNADGAYTLDMWYVLSEGNDTIDVTQETSDLPSEANYAIALDVETIGEKFGVAQIIEGDNCLGLIGNEVTLSFRAKVSNSRIDTVKAGIIAWSGTKDSVTKDVVSSWNADGTTPTLIANATFENTPADLSVSTSWARYTVTATVDTASTKNLIVFIWSDDATNPQAGDFLYITEVQLERGSGAQDFERRPVGVELALCQRYYWRSQELDFPFRNTSRAISGLGEVVFLPVTMRTTPTASIVTSFTATNVSNVAVAAATQDKVNITFDAAASNAYQITDGVIDADARIGS